LFLEGLSRGDNLDCRHELDSRHEVEVTEEEEDEGDVRLKKLRTHGKSCILMRGRSLRPRRRRPLSFLMVFGKCTNLAILNM
jgi:hypothetical protein